MKKTIRKVKKKTWHSLKDEKCPRCGKPLQKSMLLNLVGCDCGFILEESTKNVLVERDKE